MTSIVLRSGMVARYDGLRGLVCVRVLSITGTSGPCSTEQRVAFRVTREAHGWSVGDIRECFALHVIPVAAVHRRRYSTTIRRYRVECDR
jgi:hypothetical protein